MLFTRKIGKALRGKATPLQIKMAAILAGMLGFVPGFILVEDLGGGFMQAPGLILTLVFLVLVLNANLAVFGIVLLVAKLLSIVLMPLSFAIGRFLLDGPTQGLFQAMINAPVLAWFGLEHYATTGGLVVGAAFGLLSGWVFVRAVKGLRNRMAGMEEGSERYQRLSSRKSVRFLTWVFLGKGKGKKVTWKELAESEKKGLPVRIPGVVVVLVLAVGLWAAHSFLAGPALRNATQSGLEHWNGATVDLAEASVDLGEGQVRIGGLAMADPNALIKNLFEARTMEFKLGTGDLLKRRFVIDRLESREAATGSERETPGELIVKAEPPPPPPPEGDSKTIEDYLEEAEKWKQRLQQVSRWLEQLGGGEEPIEEQTPEQRAEQIEQAAELYGLAAVRATHLVEDTPIVLIRQLVFEGVTAVDWGNEMLDLHAKNLSTSPRLVQEPLELTLKARSGKFAFTFRLDAAAGGIAQTSFEYEGLPVDDIAGQLVNSPIRGGTMDLSIAGNLDLTRVEGPWLDMPLRVTLHDTTLSLQGLGETEVDDLLVPLGLRGPIAAPRISIDDQALADALVAAGKAELANQLRSRAGEVLGDEVPGVGDVLGGAKTPGQLLEEAKKKAEEEAKKKAEEQVKGLLPGGLLGGKKKTDPDK